MIRNKVMGMSLAALLVAGLAGCADNNRDEARGGGGGATHTERAAADQRADRNGNDMGDQLRANLSTDLTTEGRDFAEAYARMPWVHANIAAGDWERALDDLKFVSKQIDDLNRDNDVSAPIKAKIVTLKPMVAQLSQQIQKHDKAALQTSATVLNRFAAVTNDAQVLAWMGDRTKGGGAGR
ncbi:hypothetical protein D3C72_551970 [compost metagenome]